MSKNIKNNKGTTIVRIRNPTSKKLKWLAKQLHRTQPQLLQEIVDGLFDSASEFDKDLLMLIDCCGNQCLVTFGGRAIESFGAISVEFTKKPTKEVEIKEECEKEEG